MTSRLDELLTIWRVILLSKAHVQVTLNNVDILAYDTAGDRGILLYNEAGDLVKP